jgi:hypothetical protein
MEEWRVIPGYEGIYSVSNLGRIRINKDRRNIRQGSLLKQTLRTDGYLSVGLRRDHEASATGFAVSRLVLRAFCDEPPSPEHQANHKNGDIIDNRLENLEWVTPAENRLHAIQVLGYDRKGERNGAAKLTEAAVIQIRVDAAAGSSLTLLAKRHRVTRNMVWNIVRGKSWRSVGGPISGPRPLGRPPRTP